LAEEIGAPTGHYPLSGYAHLVRAGLWLWEHGPASEAREHSRLTNAAQHFLERYARTFRIGRPAARLWRGAGAWLGGRFNRAVRDWRQAIALAQALAMPYEEFLAHRELAARLPEDDPRREEHHLAAQRLRRQLGLDGNE
jgi:hypothetical protein